MSNLVVGSKTSHRIQVPLERDGKWTVRIENQKGGLVYSGALYDNTRFDVRKVRAQLKRYPWWKGNRRIRQKIRRAYPDLDSYGVFPKDNLADHILATIPFVPGQPHAVILRDRSMREFRFTLHTRINITGVRVQTVEDRNGRRVEVFVA